MRGSDTKILGDFTEQCIDIYMRIHVSSLKHLNDESFNMWHMGQKFYIEYKLQGRKEDKTNEQN